MQMRRCDRGLRAVRAPSGDRAQSLWHSAAFSVSLVDVYEFLRIRVVMNRCLTTSNFANPKERTAPQIKHVTISNLRIDWC